MWPRSSINGTVSVNCSCPSSRSTSALVHPDTLTPVAVLEGRVLLAVAARVGATRLIDNLLLDPVPSPVATSA